MSLYYRIRDLTPLPIRIVYRPIRRWIYNRFKRAQPKLLASYYRLCPTAKDPFFLLATPRSGTNLLLSYLQCHPRLSVLPGEPLHERRMARLGLEGKPSHVALEYLRHRMNFTRTRCCGAKLMDYQLTMLGISLPQLSGCFPNARYMVLYREDLLQQYLSWKCASHLWLWYMRRGKCYRQTPDQLPPLQISLSELTSFCQEHLHFYRNLQAWEKIGGRVIWCRYEDLVEDPQLVCNRLFEFLGFSAVHVSTQLIKMINRKPREMISNFEEVAPLISNETTKLKLDPTPLSAASASTRRRAPHNSQLLNGLQL